MYARAAIISYRNIQSKMTGQRTQRIKMVLEESLGGVSYLEIINESHMHSVPKNSETHFKIVVVSSKFNDLSLIKRHQKINTLLKEEFETGLHALSIVAKTSEEWVKMNNKKIDPSPNCLGGFGK